MHTQTSVMPLQRLATSTFALCWCPNKGAIADAPSGGFRVAEWAPLYHRIAPGDPASAAFGTRPAFSAYDRRAQHHKEYLALGPHKSIADASVPTSLLYQSCLACAGLPNVPIVDTLIIRLKQLQALIADHALPC